MDRQLLTNPFRTDVVTSPEQPITIDVPEIHRDAFHLCQQVYDFVIRERSSSSVLIDGEAGCGKTHLLSRLRGWLSGEMKTRPSQIPAMVVSIRLETAPNQIWRHIRRRFAEELMRKAQDGVCPLGVCRK
jgi:ABC-type uncharacterized transport system fused permease/ATPase subunit